MKSTIKLDIDQEGKPFIKISHCYTNKEDLRDKLLGNFLSQTTDWLKITGFGGPNGPDDHYYNNYEVRPTNNLDLIEESDKMKDKNPGYAHTIVDPQISIKEIEELMPCSTKLLKQFLKGKTINEKISYLVKHYEMTKVVEDEVGGLHCPDCFFNFVTQQHES